MQKYMSPFAYTQGFLTVQNAIDNIIINPPLTTEDSTDETEEIFSDETEEDTSATYSEISEDGQKMLDLYLVKPEIVYIYNI